MRAKTTRTVLQRADASAVEGIFGCRPWWFVGGSHDGQQQRHPWFLAWPGSARQTRNRAL